MGVFLAIGIGVAVALWLTLSAERARRGKALARRADTLCGAAASAPRAPQDARWRRFKAAVTAQFETGLANTGIWSRVFLTVIPVLVGLLWGVAGFGAAALFAVGAFGAHLALREAHRRRRERRFNEKLPIFLERVRRLILVGNTFQNAFIQAAKSADPALGAQLEPVLRRVHHGGSFAEGIESLARQIGTVEMYMLSAYVQTNARYGGKVAQTLSSLIAQLAQKTHLEREMAAATSETRASALILLGLTVLVMIAVSVMNRDYLTFFFATGTGRAMFAAIVCWPLIGVMLMRRILSVEM